MSVFSLIGPALGDQPSDRNQRRGGNPPLGVLCGSFHPGLLGFRRHGFGIVALHRGVYRPCRAGAPRGEPRSRQILRP